MREEPDLRAAEVLLAGLTWFAGPYRALADDFGEDLTVQVVFNELAEVTSRLLLGAEGREELLETIFGALEQVALAPGVDATEAVAFAFLDALEPGALELAGAYLNPATEALLARLDAGDLGYDLPLPAEGDARADGPDDGPAAPQARRSAPSSAPAAAMHAARSPATSASVSVRSGAQKRSR